MSHDIDKMWKQKLVNVEGGSFVYFFGLPSLAEKQKQKKKI